jgi:hypothetical protein
VSKTLTPAAPEQDPEEETLDLYARLFHEFEASFFADSWPKEGFASRALKFGAAVGLGVFSAGLSIFLVFIILNMFLHYSPKS